LEFHYDQPHLHRSAEIEDLAHLTSEDINKPLVDSQQKSKQALIVVDIQNDYFPGGKWILNGMDAAADNAAQLLSAARASDDLVIHIRHEFPTSDAPFFSKGSIGVQIHSKVQNREDEHVIVKSHINAFRETKLKDILDAITRAAHDFGYNCIVIHDACASRELEFNGIRVPAEHVHAAFMAAIGFAYAKTISTELFLKDKKSRD
ncbi:unnamed protein product, partial [Rotaria sp. Silwood2]